MPKDAHTTDEKKSFAARLLRPKAMLLGFVLLLVVISPLLIRGWYLSHVPDFPEPFDPVPLLEYTVPDAENAFTDYRMAVSLFVQPSPEVSELREQIYEQGWQLANDDIRQFLHDNEDALLAWKAGTEKDKALYIPAKDYTISTLLEVTQELRQFQRVAILRCKKLESEGKPQEAWEWYRASIRASRHSGIQGCYIERLVGMALFHETAKYLESWAANSRLTSKDLKRAVAQLQSDWKLTEKPSRVLQVEYLTSKHTMENVSEELKSELGMSSRMLSDEMMFLFGEPELSLRVMRLFYYNQLAFCDLPLYQRPPTVGLMDLYDDPKAFTQIGNESWNSEEFHSFLDRAKLAQLLLPASSSMAHAFDREEARYRTLMVTLAGHAFRRDHGRFPKTLDELAPNYLDEIPVDPFDGKPLKYRFDPKGPVVYSVFKNLTDDGGVEWNHIDLPVGKSDPDDLGYQMREPTQ